MKNIHPLQNIIQEIEVLRHNDKFPKSDVDAQFYRMHALLIKLSEFVNSLNPILSAADRGTIDEIIFALKNLEMDKMLCYTKEINFLKEIRKL